MGDATSEQAKKHAPNKSLDHRQSPTQQGVNHTFGGVLQKSSITQLQRTHGNRFVLQMVRGATPRSSVKSSAFGGKKIIQLDRLVEFPTGKDVADFAATRKQVETSLKTPTSGNWFAREAFRLGPGETLYLWGHMDEDKIGSLSFQEVAAHMVRNGFRGCAAIRLIGCNNQIVPLAAPKKLHLALTYYLANPAQAIADNDSDSDTTDDDEGVPDGDITDDDIDEEEGGDDPSIGHWADPATAMAAPTSAGSAAASPKPAESVSDGRPAAAASAGASASAAPPSPMPTPMPMGASSSSSSSSSSSAAPARAVPPMASAAAAVAAVPVKAPVVFATKGPLFSSSEKGFTEGWKVATPTPKQAKRRMEQQEVLEHLRGGPTALPDSEIEGLVAYYSAQTRLDLKPHAEEAVLTQLEDYFEKEIERLQRGIAEGNSGQYPTLKRPAPTAEDPTKTEWNPEAWVSFP